MKLGIITDIHDNVWTLQAALARLQDADLLICCGDLCSPFVVGLMAEGFRKPIHVVEGNNEGDWRRITQAAGKHSHVTLHGEFCDPKSSRLITSPSDDTITLNLRIVPYGNDQRLLLAKAVSQQQRLEQIRRDFVGNVSHELRTPLTVIKGFVETLSESGDECATRWHRSLELMEQQTGRMQQIVEDLLLLTRLETDRTRPQREEVAMSALLGDIVMGATALAEPKHQTLTLDCDTTANLSGAERELYSAFTNLVTNAIRYTPEGGTIRLRWWADQGV